MAHTSTAGLPADFLAKMRSLLAPDEFDAFLAAFDSPPRVGLRVNTLKLSPENFSSIAPFSLAPLGSWEPAAYLVTDDSRPGRHPYHDAGLYYLQEPSAMVAGALLGAAPGTLVLDLAAAPGGKATHLAARMLQPGATGEQADLKDVNRALHPRQMHAANAPGESALRRAMDEDGLLVANDMHAGRARLLAENLARCGVVNVLVTQEEPARLAQGIGAVFDRVLIDAPCSGEGMFRRLESVEWSEAIVAACARRQRNLLALAPDLVRPGGRLLYTTCTFSPEENEAVVATLLEERADFQLAAAPAVPGAMPGRPEWAAGSPRAEELAAAVRLWPHRFSGEGHFLALMRLDGADEPALRPRPFAPNSPSAEALRLWRAFAAATLTLPLPKERLHVHGDRLYLLPRRAIAPGRVRIVRYGLLLGELRRGHFRPAHDLALCLTDADANALRWRPDDPRLRTYLSGADLPTEDATADGWTLVTVDGFGLGWAKQAGGRLKNHFPHAARRAL